MFAIFKSAVNLKITNVDIYTLGMNYYQLKISPLQHNNVFLPRITQIITNRFISDFALIVIPAG